jgi:hypothetical protein
MKIEGKYRRFHCGWQQSIHPHIGHQKVRRTNRNGWLTSSNTSKYASHHQICVRRYSSMAQSYQGTRFARRHLIFGNIFDESLYILRSHVRILYDGYVTRVPAFSAFVKRSFSHYFLSLVNDDFRHREHTRLSHPKDQTWKDKVSILGVCLWLLSNARLCWSMPGRDWASLVGHVWHKRIVVRHQMSVVSRCSIRYNSFVACHLYVIDYIHMLSFIQNDVLWRFWRNVWLTIYRCIYIDCEIRCVWVSDSSL